MRSDPNSYENALKNLIEIVEAAIRIGDWQVDGRCDPEAILARAKRCLGPKSAEVRLNGAGTLDEVVATGATVHLEQMDNNHWFLSVGEVAVWLHAKGTIKATYELRHDATQHPTSKEGA